MKPGDAVLVLERRGEQQLVYNALVASSSMREPGARGEQSIDAVIVIPNPQPDWPRFMCVERIVHISHRDWLEGRAGLAYEELPHPPHGVCRYCRCTTARACAGGCAWVDIACTVCSSEACVAQWKVDAIERDLEELSEEELTHDIDA